MNLVHLNGDSHQPEDVIFGSIEVDGVHMPRVIVTHDFGGEIDGMKLPIKTLDEVVKGLLDQPIAVVQEASPEPKVFAMFNGAKTYLAALGLFGLAVYQFTQNDYAGAVQSFMAGLAALGLRHAVQKLEAK